MPNPTIAATHSLPCENVLRAGGANGVYTPMMFVRTTKRGGQSGEVKPPERDHGKSGWEMGATFLCGLQTGQKGIPPAPEFSVSGCC